MVFYNINVDLLVASEFVIAAFYSEQSCLSIGDGPYALIPVWLRSDWLTVVFLIY